MSTTLTHGSPRRMGAIARTEGLLLRRNPIALLNAVVVPVAVVAFVRSALPPGAGGVGAQVVIALTAFTLLLGVYYNLVTALVARREDLVLKRMRTGEISDAEIIAGTAAPAVALAWGQVVIGVGAAVFALGMGLPTNGLLAFVAVALGTAVFVLAAAASTALTRSVEMAQVTTAPVLLVSMLASGLMFPLHVFPGAVQGVAHALPMTAMIDLLRLGLTGTPPSGPTVGVAASFAAAALPVLTLAAWVAAGVWATRRWLRWEPRR